jgi:hypothetical protein
MTSFITIHSPRLLELNEGGTILNAFLKLRFCKVEANEDGLKQIR